MQHFYQFTENSVILSLQGAELATAHEVHIECIDHRSRLIVFAPVTAGEACETVLPHDFNLVTGRLFVNIGDIRWALPQPFAFPEHLLANSGFIDTWLAPLTQRFGSLARVNLLRSIANLSLPRSKTSVVLHEKSLLCEMQCG